MIEIYGHTKKNIHKINYSCFTFSGGELQVKIEGSHPEFNKIVFKVWLNSSEEIIKLLLLHSAVVSNMSVFNTDLVLKIGYLPYARQDRVCSKGEAFSSFVFNRLISNVPWDRVEVADPHSEESTCYFKNVVVRPQSTFVVQANELYEFILAKEILVVAPDKGSTEKVEELVGDLPYIQGSKIREPSTGKLSGFSYEGDVEGKDLIIIDDICDGGGTFIGLTKKLLEGGAKSVSLYVTHGIFSKGIDVLYEGGIYHIYTTNTIQHGYPTTERFTNLYWS